MLGEASVTMRVEARYRQNLFMSAWSLTLAAGICPLKPGLRWAPALNGCADLNITVLGGMLVSAATPVN